MQLLSRATKRVAPAGERDCAAEVLETVPVLLWYVRRHMRKHRKGLSVPQFRTLVKVRNDPGATLSTVAEKLGASLPTASRSVGILVSRGYIRRVGSKTDRRQVLLEVTARGAEIIDAARNATLERMREQFAGLTAPERRTVGEAMGILREFLDLRCSAGGLEGVAGANGREKASRRGGGYPASVED